ncbi:MAG TPA: phosphatidylglycerophosphatase A [Methylomirabilota bacterium]|nr:phosphatidylglycerophosphatase A [Methylomirabilota bacterium]
MESSGGARRLGALDRVAFAIATAGGAGYAPVASGTVGSAVTLVLLWLIPFTPLALAWTLAAVIVAGLWAGGRVERVLGHKDPGIIVVDEVAGMMLSVLLLPRTIPVLLVAFILFRLFDVWKPFPAHESQAFTGGLGVMLDDLIAGAYALILVMGARALFGVPA